MLTMTEAAGARLTNLLSSKSIGAVARIVQQSERLHLRVGTLRDGDQTFSHHGQVVLAIDSEIARTLSLRELDLCTTGRGARLRIKSARGFPFGV